jgi:hypothetical protein
MTSEGGRLPGANMFDSARATARCLTVIQH